VLLHTVQYGVLPLVIGASAGVTFYHQPRRNIYAAEGATSIQRKKKNLRDFRFSQRSRWTLKSAVTLSRVKWTAPPRSGQSTTILPNVRHCLQINKS